MPGHCPACELRSLPADAVTRKKATAKGQLEDRTRGRFPFMGDRVIYQLGRESPPFPLEVTRRRDRPARWSYPGVPVELPVSGACGCPRVHGCSLVSHLPTACAAVCADQPGQFNDVCRPLVRCKGWYGATKLLDYSPSSSPSRVRICRVVGRNGSILDGLDVLHRASRPTAAAADALHPSRCDSVTHAWSRSTGEGAS